MLRNVDPLSRNPVDGYFGTIESLISGSMEFFKNRNYLSFHVTLIHLPDEWQDKLWAGYLKSCHFRRILLSLQELHKSKKQWEPAAVPGIEVPPIIAIGTSEPTNDKSPSETPPASSVDAIPDEPKQESEATDSQTLQQFAESMKDQLKTITDG